MRISATSRSSSVCDTLGAHSFRLDDARHRDDLVAAHDERPRLACGQRDLCVHEHVLDLLRPSGEPVAGAPGSYLKAWHVRGDSPFAPAHLAVERERRALEPDAAVLPDGGPPAAEIEPPRARSRSEQLRERGRLVLRKPQQVALGSWMELAQARKNLVADQPALRLGVRHIGPELEPGGSTIRLGLLAPHLEQRPHDAVLPAGLYSLRRTARDE